MFLNHSFQSFKPTSFNERLNQKLLDTPFDSYEMPRNTRYSPLNIKNVGFLGRVGMSFSPASISNLTAWYDFSDLSTITKDGSDRVSQVNDKSGNGHHLKQGTAGSQPLWLSANRNSKDVIDFVSDRWLQVESAERWTALTQPLHIFVVSEGGDGTMIDGESSGFQTLMDGTSSINDRISIASVTFLDVVVTNFEDFWHYWAGLFDTPNSDIRVDGTNEITGTTGTEVNKGITVGARFGGDLGMPKKAGEITVYDKEVSGQELTDLETYFSDRWGF